MKKILSLMLALALCLGLTACGGTNDDQPETSQPGTETSSPAPEETPAETPEESPEAPEETPAESAEPTAPAEEEPSAEASLSLNSSDFTLFAAGASYTLKAETFPAGASVTFTSDNEEVATVDQNGKVTAVAPGTAKITVTAGDLTATCIVRCRWEESKPSTGGGSSSSSGNSGSSSTPETPAPAQVDLSAFYTTESGKYEFGMITLADAELAANVYPGLFDIASEQCLPYINMMTMNTSEIVLVQVTNSSDVDKVKSILQSRIDAQVEGGAWYPSAIDAWQNNSRIVSNGNYIMMVVHESCDSIVSDFNALF